MMAQKTEGWLQHTDTQLAVANCRWTHTTHIKECECLLIDIKPTSKNAAKHFIAKEQPLADSQSVSSRILLQKGRNQQLHGVCETSKSHQVDAGRGNAEQVQLSSTNFS